MGAGRADRGDPAHGAARPARGGAELGYDVMMGHEFEFYLLDPETKQPLFGGVHIFNATRNQYVPFLDGLLDTCRLPGSTSSPTTANTRPRSTRSTSAPASGLDGADKAFTFKNAIKELAHRTATGHLHVQAGERHGRLRLPRSRQPDRPQDGKKRLLQEGRARRPERRVRAFTRASWTTPRRCRPLIGPTPNCYHRLKPHTFAPSNISWGVEDRTAMVRIKDPGEANCHIEMRAASGLSNPYLSVAAVIAAGLLGIKGKGKLPAQSKGPPRRSQARRSWPAAWRRRWTPWRPTSPAQAAGRGLRPALHRGEARRARPLPQPRHRLGTQRVPRGLLTLELYLGASQVLGFFDLPSDRLYPRRFKKEAGLPHPWPRPRTQECGDMSFEFYRVLS